MSAFVHEFGRDSASPFILWGEALLDDPHAALSDILSGRGARGAQQRAEPEDFLADLMAHPAWQEQRAHLLERLDAALLNWLETCIEWSPALINRFGTRAYAARIADALKVAARLPMKVTARHLMRDQSAWDNRFRGLRWPGDIDPLQQFNLVLAQHQTDIRFVSRWFAACDEAAWGSPYWQTSLSTGLIGLRKLPDTADSAPERRVAVALARFAALALQRGMSSHVVQTTFRRRTAALTVLYPRHDGYWQDVWDWTLEDLPPPIAREAGAIRTDWFDHLPARERADGGQAKRDGHYNTYGSIATRVDSFPYHETRKEIEDAISRASSVGEDLWGKTRDLIHALWNYASKSGDSYDAVRTTHKLCNRLLQLEPSEPYLAEIQVLTLQAIETDAGNAYMWDLRARVLSALGLYEASLSVRWESMRRLPDNCVLRTSLAETLLEHHRDAVAESLLRETMKDFPSNAHNRHILATMLSRQGRQEEARDEYLAFETLAPDNPYGQSLVGVVASEHEEEAQVASAGFSWDGDMKAGTDLPRQPESGQSDEQENGRESIEAMSEISAYLGRLADQVPLLESYFAPSESRNGNGTTPGARRLDEITSESELVAAHRVGLMAESEGREHLEAWVRGCPSSYSARLLLAWQGREGNGLDREALSAIAEEFPENRRWNNWLCYGFASSQERSRLRRDAKDSKDKTEATFWRGRLSAVYPDLETEEDENDSAVRYDPTAMKRLLEDVAFAGAERAVPSVSTRGYEGGRPSAQPT